MPNARVGIKAIKSIKIAIAKAAHIFREDGVAPGGGTPNIIPFLKPVEGAFTHPNMMDQNLKRKLQKDKQTYLHRAKQYREANKIELAKKQDKKIEQIEKQLAEVKHTNSKKYVQFVELELVITEFKPNQKDGEVFKKLIPKFLNDYFGDSIELIAGAVHLDQSSLHGHVIIKPIQKWSELMDRIANPDYYKTRDEINLKYCDLKRTDRSEDAKKKRENRDFELKKIYRAVPDPYYVLTQAWWNFMNKHMNNSLNPIVRGGAREYVDLPTYKKMSRHIEERTIELDNRENAIKEREKDLISKENKVRKILSDLRHLKVNINTINDLKGELNDAEAVVKSLQNQKEGELHVFNGIAKELEEIKIQRVKISEELEQERKALDEIKAIFEKANSSEPNVSYSLSKKK